jgi:outer membrane protein assembly factor BamD (BamD/ComL family)
MYMKTVRLVLCALCITVFFGCSDKSKELFETAAFEESQSNFPHALEIYQELVRAYPESREAEVARARIADLKSRQ